jgi:hypothetical protein
MQKSRKAKSDIIHRKDTENVFERNKSGLELIHNLCRMIFGYSKKTKEMSKICFAQVAD